MTRRAVARVRWLLAAACAVALVRCASSGASSSGGGLAAGGAGGACPGCVPDAAVGDVTQVDVPGQEAAPTPDAGADAGFNALCGPGCLPDDVAACVDAGAEARNTAEPKILDASSPVPAPGPGRKDDAASPPEAGAAFGCHVRRRHGSPVGECGPAGGGRDADPCMASRDCAAGYGCVGESNAGTCRPFCCSGPDLCSSGTYCAERPLRDDVTMGVDPLVVPVCVPADGCSLSDPYPCPSGQSCTCPEDTACTIVRGDGTTGCVPPGSGGAGEACPCAAGHICSKATRKCLKICALTATAIDCGTGKCQATGGFPEGFGVCVGAQPDGG